MAFDFSVSNIVATSKINLVNLAEPITDLLNLTEHKLKVSVYKPKVKIGRQRNTFAGFFLKLPHGTISIFSSGRLVFTGVKSLNQLEELVDDLNQHVKKHLPNAIFEIDQPKIVNIIGHKSLGVKVDICAFAKSCPQAFYEPELFSNLQYTYNSKSVKGIVSRNGKIIVVGCTTYKKVKDSLDELEFFTRQFIKVDEKKEAKK